MNYQNIFRKDTITVLGIYILCQGIQSVVNKPRRPRKKQPLNSQIICKVINNNR